MKIVLTFCLLSWTVSSFAKSVKNFNQVLMEEVKTEIKEDDFAFKKPASRGPASVKEDYKHKIEETPKIDKNVRQIGPNNW